MSSPHVLVIGAGLAGSFTALSLASRGVRVTLLERHGPGHDRGSSHGGSRIFRHAYAEGDYVRLATHADEGWRRLERDSGERLLWRAGGLDLETQGGPELPRIEAALREHDRPHERLDAREIRARFPAFAPPPDVQAIHQPDAGTIMADRALTAALRLAVTRGADVRFDTPVARIDGSDDGCEVTGEDGRTWSADRAVVCAGPWFAEGPLALDAPLWIEQQQVLYLAAPAGPDHGADRMPVFIDRDHGTYGMGRLEHPAAIKVADHSGGAAIRLEARPDRPDEERAALTRERVMRLLPRLGGRLAVGLCLYTNSPDSEFVIGPHPRVPSVTISAGLSGHGFKFGPALGDMLAGLAVDGSSPLASTRFSPRRFAGRTTGAAEHPR